MTTFSQCLVAAELDVYSPDPETFTPSLETFRANHEKIFQCAVETEIGIESSAYTLAIDREQNRALRSLGAHDPESWRDFSRSYWSSADVSQKSHVLQLFDDNHQLLKVKREQEVEKNNSQRIESAGMPPDRKKFIRFMGTYLGIMGGFTVGGYLSILIFGGKTQPQAALLGIAGGAIAGGALGGWAGYKIADKLTEEQPLHHLLSPLPEYDPRAPKLNEIFDDLEEQDKHEIDASLDEMEVVEGYEAQLQAEQVERAKAKANNRKIQIIQNLGK